ncbi:MAG: TonB-dependent receptor [Azospirillaceae bacterium]|nr:TonB-dependent receptor [Azospirillaceae bacterium]
MPGTAVAQVLPAAPAVQQGAAPQGAPQQDPDMLNGIQEIVVTAQKRSENAQNVPIAITALNPEAMAAAGVTDTSDLKSLTPGLNFNTNLGGFGQPRVRGVGTTATGPGIENPVATYVDGVYIGSSAGALFALNDVEQVAVLKGPQGTLFGRNATGGLIQVTTKEPTQDFHADVEGTYGNYDTFQGSAFLSGGITDTVAVSLAALREDQRDGYGKNLYNGQDVQNHDQSAVRAKILWKPDADTKFLLSADYETYHAADPAIRTYGLTTLGTPTPGGPYDIDLDVQPFLQTRQWGTSLTAQHDFDNVEVLSITAYRNSYFHTIFDADQIPVTGLVLNETQRDQQFSQELQVQSIGDGPFKWTAGLYYFWSKGLYDPLSTSGAFLSSPTFPLTRTDLYVDQSLNSYAGFAQGTYALDDATNLTAGLRYTVDQRAITENQTLTVAGFPVAEAPVDDAKTFDKLTWRLSLDHRFSPELLGYISYNRGFKSGSFAPDTFPVEALKPETLDAYEVGLKSDLWDRRLRVNVSAFYYDQTNLQVNQIVQGVLLVYNASGATSYGMDADVQFQATSHLTLNAGLSLLHARYKEFENAFELFPLATGGNSFDQNGNATGKQLQNTPAVTVNAGASYDIPTAVGKFTLAGNYYYNGGYYADPQNRTRQNSYNTLDASLTWASNDGQYTARLWGKNLTDEFYTQQVNPLNVGDNWVAAPPRTYGLTLGVHF